MHKVKLLYGIGYGTSGTGQVLPISNKFLAIFVKGSATIGPSKVIIMDDYTRTQIKAINIIDT